MNTAGQTSDSLAAGVITAPVTGYKAQTPEAVNLVNKFKDHEIMLGKLFNEAKQSGLADPRMLAVAKTQAQQAYMWFNRAVFQPTDVFE